MQSSSKRLIKKYPNRRLYDTETSAYITLEDVRQLVLDKIDISVVDAKTGDDLTTNILLQIILETQSLGKPFLSYDVLTQLIRFYGSSWHEMVSGHLEKNLNLLMSMQEQWQGQVTAMQEQFPFPLWINPFMQSSTKKETASRKESDAQEKKRDSETSSG